MRRLAHLHSLTEDWVGTVVLDQGGVGTGRRLTNTRSYAVLCVCRDVHVCSLHCDTLSTQTVNAREHT